MAASAVANGSVYLCLDRWYCIELSNDNDKVKVGEHVITKRNGATTCATVIHPLPESGSICLAGAGAVMVGPFIYIVGGKDFAKRVDRYDTRSSVCVSCSPMIVGRVKPIVAVFADKLFVMGGTELNNQNDWAEVFDMRSLESEWELLPPIPMPPPKHTMFYAVDNQRKLILVSSTNILYSFHLPTQTWQLFDDLNIYLGYLGQAIVVDKIMYYWSFGMLHYYNTETQDIFQATIKGLDEEGWVNSWEYSGCHPKLHHLGGDTFCLVWLDHMSHTFHGCNYKRVLCSRIRAYVSKNVDGKASFTAFVEYSQSFLAPAPAPPSLTIGHAFLMLKENGKKNLVEDRAL